MIVLIEVVVRRARGCVDYAGESSFRIAIDREGAGARGVSIVPQAWGIQDKRAVARSCTGAAATGKRHVVVPASTDVGTCTNRDVVSIAASDGKAGIDVDASQRPKCHRLIEAAPPKSTADKNAVGRGIVAHT